MTTLQQQLDHCESERARLQRMVREREDQIIEQANRIDRMLEGHHTGRVRHHEPVEPTGFVLQDIVLALRKINETNEKIMTSLDQLTSAVSAATASATALTAAVDTAVTELGTLAPTDQQLAALTGSVTALQATLDAQTARLNAATAPAPVPTP